jgi:hypothetical protein
VLKKPKIHHSLQFWFFLKKKKKKKTKKSSSQPLPHAATPDSEIGNSTALEFEGEDDNVTEPNEVGSPWTGRIGSSWTQSWPGVAARLPLVHGEAARPSSRSGGGFRANPSIRASLTVGFGLAVTASFDPDSGGFRPGRCGPARALVAFSDLGIAGSVQTHVGGVGVAWLWRRVSTWSVAAWSGLGGAGGVRPGCGGADLGRGFSAWSRFGVSTTF